MFSWFKNLKFNDRIDEVSNFCIDPDTVVINEDLFVANVRDSRIRIIISSFLDRCFRLRVEMNEYENYKRFDVAKEEILVHQEIANNKVGIRATRNESFCEIFANECRVIVNYSPISFQFFQKDVLILTINSKQSLKFYSTSHEHTVGEDFLFHGENIMVSGLAERATPLNIDDGVYQMFNLDAYGFDAGKICSIYGNIPFAIAHSPSVSAGLFWANASDTYAKFETNENGRSIKFISEGGLVDTFVFLNNPLEIIRDYCKLVGFPMLPPLWSLGYHQCRWGYKTQSDCEEVIRKLDESGFPLDCFWLDLDHLKDRSPWHFDERTFPNPQGLFDLLESDGRTIVRLCDCHLPASGDMHEANEAREKDILITEPNGQPYVGLCWPGRSTWVDFLKPEARQWWSNRTSQDRGYFWNDMNEPSAFGIWNKSLPKDCRLGDYTDREVHNAYSTFQSKATYDGMRLRDNKRPFSLTRAFFSGTQRYAWAWTGDNGSSTLHLKKSISMIVNSGICGMPFIGADVGGFSSSCDVDTLTRWYQVACWTYPFFREHCIFTASRREPYLFEPKYSLIMRDAVVERYRMIHFWYTAAWRAHLNGTPIVRPTFFDYPNDMFEHKRDSEVMIDGKVFFSLNETSPETRTVDLPSGKWFTKEGVLLQGTITIPGNLDFVPVFFKSGVIIPIVSSVGKSTIKTITRPIVITIYSHDGEAEGDIYIDDYTSNSHEDGNWVHKLFTLSDKKLTCRSSSISPVDGNNIPILKAEKILLYDGVEYIIKDVDLTLNEDWEIEII